MNYFWLTLKHKWFVFLAGRNLGVPLWRLIKHDWSRFTLSEYPHYQRQFFGDKKAPGVASAWLHHQNVNDHHWEYWIPRSEHSKDNGDGSPLPMPEGAALEMIADWMGTCRGYEGKWPKPGEWRWLYENYARVWLNQETEKFVSKILFNHGFMGPNSSVKWKEDQ